MKHQFFPGVIAFIVATFFGTGISIAACDSAVRMLRIVDLAQSMMFTQSSGILIGQSQQLQAELALIDDSLVAGLMEEQFYFADSDWISHTLTQLRAIGVAGTQGDAETVTRILQQERTSVGLSRFQVGFHNAICNEPEEEPSGSMGTSFWPTIDQFNDFFRAPTGSEAGPGTQARMAQVNVYTPAAGQTPRGTFIGVIIGGVVLLMGVTLTALIKAHIKQKRRKERHPTSYDTLIRPRAPASARWESEHAPLSEIGRPTEITNVSVSGIGLLQTSPAIRGGVVEVKIGDDWIIGTVRWSSATSLGVHLDKDLSPNCLAEIMRDSTPEQAPEPADQSPETKRAA